MKTKLLSTIALLISTISASADIISVTITGTVAPFTWNGSRFTSTPLIDNGTFGSNQNLFGASFTESWTVNTSQLSITSALLTINNTTIDYGGGGYNAVYQYHNSSRDSSIHVNNGFFDAFYINITISPGTMAMNSFVNSFGSSFPGNINTPWNYTLNPFTDNLDSPNGIGGSFSYGGIAGYLNPITFAIENLTNPDFTSPPIQSLIATTQVAVPGAIVGTGLPGLMLLLLAWLRRR